MLSTGLHFASESTAGAYGGVTLQRRRQRLPTSVYFNLKRCQSATPRR